MKAQFKCHKTKFRFEIWHALALANEFDGMALHAGRPAMPSVGSSHRQTNWVGSALSPEQRAGTQFMNRTTAVLASIGSVAVAGLIGANYGPQRPREAVWYASLRKPSYTPPGAAIGITWGILETLLCVTGYRLMMKPASGVRDVALGGWVGTLAGLAGYPATFFGSKRLGPSVAVAAAMFASTATTAITAEQVDRPAAAAMTPLVLWTGFATLLSEELWRRN